jgi:ketosteroid isomerase-like protein
MKQLFISCILLFTSFASISQTKDDIAVKSLLDEQTKAWNRGDLESFMKGYWNSDSLLFIGKSGPKYGYKTTLENYQKSYPNTTSMGELKFDILQTKRLSVIYFFVVGKWHLQRTIGDLEGHFTLLIKKVKNQWVIVADHSS